MLLEVTMKSEMNIVNAIHCPRRHPPPLTIAAFAVAPCLIQVDVYTLGCKSVSKSLGCTKWQRDAKETHLGLGTAHGKTTSVQLAASFGACLKAQAVSSCGHSTVHRP